ncbi:23S rRNA pseudouridine1911/1915/1917 synthase [Dethiosulfatibacter aminovorans DSM 17477]|uniref:Pseudouridine synthase n=1 Tax=Dethiosulfatibacter aminovorans DSM 17477 TaxID=1121476 RepID=A0A1M6DJA8_9FIRM|nr:RluA family pseudouridine synthase [Dethiosulfatibacter aminovorans]SHI73346.1 23S rRNA pseudouridine1911/1915/1917 synthase [Dethiosulfatibacter aminovorans DSM 17477]
MKIDIEFKGEGMRIDLFLKERCKDISRSYLHKLIKNNNVYVNGKCRKKNYILSEGDHIVFEVPEPEELKIEAEDIPLEIVYEDNCLAVINKPRGMVVHPAPGNYTGTMVNALMYKLDNLSSINGVIRPGIVHRIDKDTTGLLVVAKDDKSHKVLSEEIKNRKTGRFYVALVHGNVKDDEGVIELPIGRDPKNRKKMAVTEKNSKYALTRFRVLRRFGNYTYIELILETGRTHQIRVHMTYKGYPIVGDEVYGRRDNEFKMKGQLLHAKRISFIHPETGELLEFEVELPEDFRKILNILEGRL